MRNEICIIVLSSLIFATGCTDKGGATRTLEQAGYKNIRTTGYRWLAGDDAFRTGFEATSPSGMRVTGAVTRGWFKGSTIRID
jgi:hypothetical protein